MMRSSACGTIIAIFPLAIVYRQTFEVVSITECKSRRLRYSIVDGMDLRDSRTQN
jgi:hypothetical protein